MLIGDEPSNGNYARYVEMLTTGDGGEPGRVYTWRQRAARPVRWSSPTGMPPVPDELAVQAPASIAAKESPNVVVTLPDGFAVPVPASARPPTAQRQAGNTRREAPDRGGQANKAGSQARQAPPAKAAVKPQTLAEQAGKRVRVAVLTIIGIILTLTGAGRVLQAVAEQPFDTEILALGVFLLFFAVMLFKSARGLRRDANRPTVAQAPLKTASSPAPGRGTS